MILLILYGSNSDSIFLMNCIIKLFSEPKKILKNVKDISKVARLFECKISKVVRWDNKIFIIVPFKVIE